MRILMVSIGTVGDILPMLSIGRELKHRGHDIIFFTSADMRSYAETSGLQINYFLNTEFEKKMMQFDGAGTAVKEAQAYLVEEPSPKLYAAVKTFIEPNNTLLICSLASAYCGRTVADAYHIPSVLIHYTVIGLMPKAEPPRLDPANSLNKLPKFMRPFILALVEQLILGFTLGKALNRLRRQHHLGSIPTRKLYQWMNSGLPNTPPVACLGLFPQWFAAPLTAWQKNRVSEGLPPTTQFSHFALNDNAPENYQLPTTVIDFLQTHPHPIVLTFGTRAGKVQELLAIAIKACQQLNKPAIFLSRYLPDLSETLPNHILLVDYLPLSKILPYSSLLVHHAGINSAAQALAAGVPQLVRPTMGDQLDNAARLIHLGVAEEILPKHFNVKNLVKKLSRLLNEPAYNAASKNMQAKMVNQAGEPAIKNIATQIETFAKPHIKTIKYNRLC